MTVRSFAAVCLLVLGVLVVVNPFGTFAALMSLVGLSLVFDGVTDLIIIWRLSWANPICWTTNMMTVLYTVSRPSTRTQDG